MHRALAEASVLLLLLSLLAMPAYGHSGKTDANGGHTDSSTGEYHYHHGFPAHQHTDLNGDGIKDCPYDFKDKTGQNSGSRSTTVSPKTTVPTIPPATTIPATTSYSASVVARSSISGSSAPTNFSTETAAVLFFAAIVLLIVVSVLKSQSNGKQNTIDRMQKENTDLKKQIAEITTLSQHRLQETERMCNIRMAETRMKAEEEIKKSKYGFQFAIDKTSRNVQDLHSTLKSKFGADYLMVAAGAKEHTYIGSDKLPHRIDSSGIDEYVFYASSTGKYHTRKCRYASTCAAVHATEIYNNRAKYEGCSICNPQLPNIDWIFKYKHFIDALDIKDP